MPGCKINVSAEDGIEVATDRAIPAALLVNELDLAHHFACRIDDAHAFPDGCRMAPNCWRQPLTVNTGVRSVHRLGDFPEGEAPGLKFGPGLLALWLGHRGFNSLGSLLPLFGRNHKRPQSVISCQAGPSTRETAPNRRKSRRCADLHGDRQPIHRNRRCSARVSDVRDHLCIF